MTKELIPETEINIGVSPQLPFEGELAPFGEEIASFQRPLELKFEEPIKAEVYLASDEA